MRYRGISLIYPGKFLVSKIILAAWTIFLSVADESTA